MQRLYVGTYTRPAPHAPRANARGIYVFDFDPRSGALDNLRLAAELDNPSFLTVSPDHRALYAASELNEGRLSAFAVGEDGGLRFLNARPTLGSDAVYVSADPNGRSVFVANYGGGAAVAAFGLLEDGSLGPCAASARHAGRGPAGTRQDAPHPHAVLPSPDGAFAYVPDLGTDEVAVYRLGEVDSPLRRVSAVNLPSGCGPRHIAFHPAGRLAFVTLELTSQLASLSRDPETGELRLLQLVAAQPPDFLGENSPAEVLVSSCGKFVYASNRGHDSIAAWRVDDRTGHLTLIGHQPTLGNTPRGFTLSPDGAFLLVANQDSESVAVFARDFQGGQLGKVGVFACPTPTCLRF